MKFSDFTSANYRLQRGRYVEAQKKQAQVGLQPLQPDAANHPLGFDTLPGLPVTFSLDELAPASVVRQAVNDWFKLVHPVAPILHRDSFIRQLDAPSTTQNLDFLLLVVSICSATVSTLRRSAGLYAGMITVERCFQIVSTINHARGPLPISLTRCQMKYNMAASLTQDRGMDNETVQLLITESMAMTGYLLHYEVQNLSISDRELVKRLFWLCFAGQW